MFWVGNWHLISLSRRGHHRIQMEFYSKEYKNTLYFWLLFFFKKTFTVTLAIVFLYHTNPAVGLLIVISAQLIVKEKILNDWNMWAGEVNHKYLFQQPSNLISKLCVLSVSFNFRAVSVRPFLNPKSIKCSRTSYLY